MQAAEFPSADLAKRCEEELRALFEEYERFEATDPNPWATDRVAPPLAAFGERHRVIWPNDASSRFTIKGSFNEEAHLLRVDRMVFFWAAGFDLGGKTLRSILHKLGAQAVVGEGACHLEIRHDDPKARAEELAEFLCAEDFDDQFTLTHDAPANSTEYFSITVKGRDHQSRLDFDDSGVQDWAFVALLPQLTDEDPTLVR